MGTDSIRATLQWVMSFKVAFVVSMMTAATLYAGKFPSADEAARQLLIGSTYERETLLLTKAELASSAELAAKEIPSALVTRYVIRNEAGGIVGYAYLDKHLVRTLPQTLIVAVDADGILVRMKVLAFREPAEYIARDGWMEQFCGKTVEDQIRMKKNVDGITGATLTARAVSQCARRTLAIHHVLDQRGKK